MLDKLCILSEGDANPHKRIVFLIKICPQTISVSNNARLVFKNESVSNENVSSAFLIIHGSSFISCGDSLLDLDVHHQLHMLHISPYIVVTRETMSLAAV